MTTLGTELISSEAVAITELVKNAFDADASVVLVRLRGELNESGGVARSTAVLEVMDDGHGMDASVVADAWLQPATGHRRSNHTSPGGRRVLGEKGVGRFAAAKLGSQLEMTTRMATEDEVVMKVNWDEFEDADAFLDEVKIGWHQRGDGFFGPSGEAAAVWAEVFAVYASSAVSGGVPDGSTGTLLRTSELRVDWTAALVEEIRRSLARLVSPFQDHDGLHAEFRILLDLPSAFGVASGFVEPSDEFSDPPYRLDASISPNGAARIQLGGTELQSSARQVTLANSDGALPLRCGPFELRLSVWNRDAGSLKELADGSETVKSLRSTLDDIAGISVYRDGFKVLPYGERGDDWLGLDLRRVQSPTRRVSNNQVVGYVSISRDHNPELLDQTNREGFVETDAVGDLRSAVRQLLAILENERYASRPRRTRKQRGGLLDRVDLTELRDAIAEAIPRDERIKAIVTDLQRELDERDERVGEVLARYHRLATLGQLVDRVIHELGQPLAAIRQASTLAAEDLDAWDPKELNDVGESMAKSLRKRVNVILKQVGVAGDVVRRIAPLGSRRRGRPLEYEIEEAIRDAVELLSDEAKKVGAKIVLPDTRTMVTIDGAELQEVLVNLLTNSLHWLKRVDRSERVIAFEVERNSDGSVALTIEDSGPGVPESDREMIFEPYFTTREDGVGLGLSIAGEIVTDYYGGELELLPPGPLGGARFRATMRRRVGSG